MKNYIFIAVFIFSFVAQVIIVQFGQEVFHVIQIQPEEWGICIALGFGSLPVGLLIRLLPLEHLIPRNNLSSGIELDSIVQNDIAHTLEESAGHQLSIADRIALKNAIARANQTGFTRIESRDAFAEGLKLGAQVALSLKETSSSNKSGQNSGIVSEQERRSAQELWMTARRVKHQVGVVEAFRRHRRE